MATSTERKRSLYLTAVSMEASCQDACSLAARASGSLAGHRMAMEARGGRSSSSPSQSRPYCSDNGVVDRRSCAASQHVCKAVESPLCKCLLPDGIRCQEPSHAVQTGSGPPVTFNFLDPHATAKSPERQIQRLD